MKKILGLDLGSASIGWALVEEDSKSENSKIIKTGVRVVQGEKEKNDFLAGKAQTDNQDRTTARGARRRLQRYKLRRKKLLNIFEQLNWIPSGFDYSEQGDNSTYQSLEIRAKGVTERISKEDFVKVLLAINKKRGYKSNRKANDGEDGELIDGMAVAKKLAQAEISPAEFALQQLDKEKLYIPQFYKSDLEQEFENIWEEQTKHFPNMLTEDFRKAISGKGKTAIAQQFKKQHQIYTYDTKGLSKTEKRRLLYQFRVDAQKEPVPPEQMAIAINEVLGEINAASGYLAEISDRGKALFFNNQTIGQYLYEQVKKDPHARTKGQVFYRQDYYDEFNAIWDKQAEFYPELTPLLKTKVGVQTIFYQRRLKSQKGLISKCELEGRKALVEVDGKIKEKIVGPKAIPSSSPLYQEFRIWQTLNNIEIIPNGSVKRPLTLEEKHTLLEYLNIRPILKTNDILKILGYNSKTSKVNHKEILGNRTNVEFANKFLKIAELTGQGEHNLSKLSPKDYYELIQETFNIIDANPEVLTFDAALPKHTITQQPYYQLWHLLYSYEGDNSPTGNEALYKKLNESFGFKQEFAQIIGGIVFEDDYGSLSAKAITKIWPFLTSGQQYSEAAENAGYNHSGSLNKEELAQKVLKPKMDLLPKNSLRNPLVEKILNQMVNVVNTIIDEFGKPDEVRIELARELKQSQKERDEATKRINKAQREHQEIRELLKNDFGLSYVSRKDIIKYKLYKELEPRGYKTLYSNTFIPANQLFQKDFDIEHIIPQSKLFDDSFSNKTLELSSVNKEKGNLTAYDYLAGKVDAFELEKYIQAVNELNISPAKKKKLLMAESEIPDGFIERDLRNSQYIAKKAREILLESFKAVNPTVGKITDALRQDWQLVDVLKEINWDKYEKIGQTTSVTNREGKELKRIKDWTKRDDHRHHAMDALTVAFTKTSFVQYFNNLSAKSDKSSNIYGIMQKEMYRDDKNKLRFHPPMPIKTFRAEAKKALENTLISFKTNNKVVTQNVNRLKNGHKQTVSTPRGQLHKETIYGAITQFEEKQIKVDGKLTPEMAQYIVNETYKKAVLKRLQGFNNNAKTAFTGKNAINKQPLLLDSNEAIPNKISVRLPYTVYTKREGLSKEFNAKKIEKVVDGAVKKILKERLKEYGSPDKAFGDLDKNPVWFDKDSGIKINSVIISAINKAEPLHDKKDKAGNLILDKKGNPQPVDFVSTGNNHHVAIYKDPKGKLVEKVVSFYEAVARVKNNLPIVDKDWKKEEGYAFQFTLKTNEMFVFPNPETGFLPDNYDLKDPKNYHLISPNLFRVQKFSNGDYVFRHHLETVITRDIKGFTFLRLSTSKLENVQKIRLNHLGIVVAVGEY